MCVKSIAFVRESPKQSGFYLSLNVVRNRNVLSPRSAYFAASPLFRAATSLRRNYVNLSSKDKIKRNTLSHFIFSFHSCSATLFTVLFYLSTESFREIPLTQSRTNLFRLIHFHKEKSQFSKIEK